MTAPKSDFMTAPQHHFSVSRWSQHLETALKVHELCHAVKLPKSSPWPTDYYFWLVVSTECNQDDDHKKKTSKTTFLQGVAIKPIL